MKTTQTQLPTLTDWREPQTVRGSELLRIIARANAAGYRAHRMTVKQSAIYEVHFMRQPSEAIAKLTPRLICQTSTLPEASQAGVGTTANAVRSVLERDLNQTAGAFKADTSPEAKPALSWCLAYQPGVSPCAYPQRKNALELCLCLKKCNSDTPRWRLPI